MLARLQRCITLGLLALALAWAAWQWAAGRPGWAALGVAVILFGHAAFLAGEFVALAVVHRGDAAAPAASALELLRAWWGEVGMAPRVFCWRQPFRSRAVPDFLPDVSTSLRSGRRGVLLVHGLVCNRGFWNPWLRHLQARGVPCMAIDLEPVFGSIDDYVAPIERAVRRLEAATGQAPVIVGHSMGGLAVRAWLASGVDPARVHHVVTIASPHHGTWLARHARTTNGLQMRIGSDWLAQLARREPAAAQARFTCFYGNCDNIVFPAACATLARADNRHVPGRAHVHMAFVPQVLAEVERWLSAPA